MYAISEAFKIFTFHLFGIFIIATQIRAIDNVTKFHDAKMTMSNSLESTVYRISLFFSKNDKTVKFQRMLFFSRWNVKA